MTPPPTDENDNNLSNVDEGFENDNISVTGSPLQANSTEDDERRSPSPAPNASGTSSGGAFTSLIQRNSGSLKKTDFLTGFSSQFQQQQQPALHPLHHQPQQHAFNPALAAQLFLQSPLMPQPSQWLYSQLYGNYDLQWFRSTLQSGSSNGLRLAAGAASTVDLTAETENGSRDHLNVAKRAVTLITHQEDDHDVSTSPPVTSTKRTPSPDEEITVVAKTKADEDGVGPIKCRTPKQTDVWRPY